MGEDAFEAIFADLLKAERFILLNFFIVAEGALWDRLHEILLQKMKEGVKVYFMYDDFGAMIRTHKHFRREKRRGWRCASLTRSINIWISCT